jgi:hypothetical protein
VEDSQKDLRSTGEPLEPLEPIEPANPPEPLVVPPDELRQQYREEYDQMVEDMETRIHYHLAEYVKVRSLKQVFSFMRLHMAIYNDARLRKGFTGGGIRGRWWAKQFWSYTIWDSRDSLERFVKSGPHALAVSRMREFAAPGSAFVEWEGLSDQDWSGAISRLEHPTRYYVDPYFN